MVAARVKEPGRRVDASRHESLVARRYVRQMLPERVARVACGPPRGRLNTRMASPLLLSHVGMSRGTVRGDSPGSHSFWTFQSSAHFRLTVALASSFVLPVCECARICVSLLAASAPVTSNHGPVCFWTRRCANLLYMQGERPRTSVRSRAYINRARLASVCRCWS